MSGTLPFHALAGIFPLMEGAEFDALVEDIRVSGLREPIVLHEGSVLDGRNRYRACMAAGVDARFETYDGTDPLGYVISLNIKRRHLDESQRAMVAARIANLGEGRPSNPASIEAVSQAEAASLLNVSRSGVQRAREVLNEGTPELVAAVDSGEVSVSRGAEIARLPEDEQRESVKAPFVTRNSGNPEWYAADHLIKAAHAVMGGIDLDPASCALANEVVVAAKFYTKNDDGLAQPWRGRIWLNPPYSTGLIEKFATRLLESLTIGDVTEACCLFNNSTDAKWFQSLALASSAVCFTKGRKNYWHPNETLFTATSPLQGQSIIYFGNNQRKFVAEFSKVGIVLLPAAGEITP
jgi:ParB family transcriptional regulator, chromosome partitioning protein